MSELLNKYPMLVRHHCCKYRIRARDRAVANGAKPSLTRGKKHQIRRFLKPIEGDNEIEARVGNEMLDALQDHRDRKKACVAPPSVYRSVKHVFSTTSIVERLFSRAKIMLSDLRNRMLPLFLKDVLNMWVNRHLWNEAEEMQEVHEAEEVLVILAIYWQFSAIIAIIIARRCNNCN